MIFMSSFVPMTCTMALKKTALLSPRPTWCAVVLIVTALVLARLRLLHVIAVLTVVPTVEVETLTTATATEMTVATSAVMSGVVMIAVVIDVTDVVMVVVGVFLIVPPLPMSTPTVKYARYMVTLHVTVGGAALRTRTGRRGMMEKRVHILHPMEWIPTGIPTQEPPSISLVS
jgi:hypothetical protein